MSYHSIIEIVISNLQFTKTDIEILKLLISKKGGLLISDIIYHIKRSDRNIRKRLKKLINEGMLKRKIEVLDNKRLAYRYTIESEKRIIEIIKNHLNWKIENLNNLLPTIDE